MRRFLLVASLLWGAVCSYAQPCGISYNYDVAGNRIKKYECWGVSSLEAGETALIQSDPVAANLPAVQLQRDADLSGMIVFPNPAVAYFEIRAGGELRIVEGKACRLMCKPEADALLSRNGCFFPEQFDPLSQKLIRTKPNKENPCQTP